MPSVLLWVGWNLLLAALPIWWGRRLASQVERLRAGQRGLWVAVALWIVLWLAFLPNTCYLLTEWRHWLDEITQQELWTRWSRQNDHVAFWALVGWTVFYAGFSLAGMVAWWLAWRPVHRALAGWNWRPVVTAAIYWLSALGVYLGLELRLNSWDLAHRPLEVVRLALAALSHPVFVLYVTGFAVLVWLLNELIETVHIGWRHRLGRQQDKEAPGAQ